MSALPTSDPAPSPEPDAVAVRGRAVEAEPSGAVPGAVTTDELARGVVIAAGLRSPVVHRGLVATLGVLAVVCLLASVTRASALPLVPLAPWVVAAVGVWLARTARHDRHLVGAVAVFAVGVAVSLWTMSFVARYLT